MDSDNEINLDELSGRINNLRNMEARESDTGPMEEYLDMDKITIIKMLLASQDENRQLQARLDKQDEEARLREDRLNSRIDELTRPNKSGSESQIRLMDQLAELQRQLKQMSGQYGEMLIELKRQEDLNRIARKEKYASRRQSVKKEGKDDRNKDRQILRLLGIEIGGKPLGRPSKEQNTKEHHDLMVRNVGERNQVKATFGTGKRIYKANNIRAKRADTGASWVGACYFVKNIMKFFRELLYALIEMMEIIRIIPENTGIFRNQSRVAEKTPVLAIG